MKKIIALLLTVAMVLSLAACSKDSGTGDNTGNTGSTDSSASQSDFKIGVVLVGD